MPALRVSLNHIATIRQATGAKDPDPVQAAALAELAGAQGIDVHLREDRALIQDRDVYLLKQTVSTNLNLCIAPQNELIQLAVDVAPQLVTFVPSQHDEEAAEGGLRLTGNENDLSEKMQKLRHHNIKVSLFIDPDQSLFKSALKLSADRIELNAHYFANSTGPTREEELSKLLFLSKHTAPKYDIEVGIGRGITYTTCGLFSDLPRLNALHVGHALVSRAVLVGMDTAVRDFLALL
ncbi:MAG: pyridoxine 5'-phosphate synthase [Chitinivibrionales bacterium]|nr:pyridoxine 5'-phosphate synthase [Chitinivibrionales bacterium]